MRKVVFHYVGLFLRIFSGLLLLPIVIGKIYGESFVQLEGFVLAAFISIVLGTVLPYFGEKRETDVIEGMMAATVGWVLAVAIGGIPFMEMLDWGFVNAFFEAMSGFSTAGMSLVQSISSLPTSLVFWRAFMQWMGGLGILTFFVAVVIEAGGAASSLVSAEADKTDPGKIRPSFFNAIRTLWYVYIVFTLLEAGALYLAGMDGFNSFMYSMTTMPTGGFSHTAGGLAAFDSLAIEGIVTVFMLVGGTNFLLLYRLLRGDAKSLFKDYEFKLYLKVIGVAVLVIGADLILSNGAGILQSLKSSVFHVISALSSTGFELTPIASFPEVSRLMFWVLMFVGGCLGSTTGGIKIFRLGVMFKLVVREIRSFTLPPNALNYITSRGKKLKEHDISRIVAIVFLWIAIIFLGGFVTVIFSDLSIVNALQGMTSGMGTMGPLFISQEALIGLPGVVKLSWAFGMLAGRLELLPLLVLLNAEIVKRFG